MARTVSVERHDAEGGFHSLGSLRIIVFRKFLSRFKYTCNKNVYSDLYTYLGNTKSLSHVFWEIQSLSNVLWEIQSH